MGELKPGGLISSLAEGQWSALVLGFGNTLVRFLGWEDPLEKGKTTHSTTLAWRIPWTV